MCQTGSLSIWKLGWVSLALMWVTFSCLLHLYFLFLFYFIPNRCSLSLWMRVTASRPGCLQKMQVFPVLMGLTQSVGYHFSSTTFWARLMLNTVQSCCCHNSREQSAEKNIWVFGVQTFWTCCGLGSFSSDPVRLSVIWVCWLVEHHFLCFFNHFPATGEINHVDVRMLGFSAEHCYKMSSGHNVMVEHFVVISAASVA